MLDFDGYVLRYVLQRSVMAKPTERKANTRKIVPLIPERKVRTQIQEEKKKQRHNNREMSKYTISIQVRKLIAYDAVGWSSNLENCP